MKNSPIIVALFAVTSCSSFIDEPSVYYIEPRAQIYVDRFFDEAEKRGLILKKENLIVRVSDDYMSPMLQAAGRCTIEGNQRYIYLWTGAFDYFIQKGQFDCAERLVFHEMGHAFGRPHIKSNKSIMDPGCPSEVYLNNKHLRTEFIDELIWRLPEY